MTEIETYNKALSDQIEIRQKGGDEEAKISKAFELSCKTRYGKIDVARDKLCKLERKARLARDNYREEKEKVWRRVKNLNKSSTLIIDNMMLKFNLTNLYLQEFSLYEIESPDALEILHNDKYKKIGVYIKPNRKPINCFTLWVKGESLFNHLTGSPEREIKSAPTIKELSLLWKSKGSPALSQWLKKQKKMEVLYEECIVLYKDKNWKKAYLKYRKDYYENNYSRGVDTPMYKAIIEQIKVMETNLEELPTIISELVSKEAQKDLVQRLKGEG